MRISVGTLLATVLCLPVLTAVLSTSALAASDPVAAVDAYHAALKNRDTKTALSLLEPDAVLYEQGFVEKSRSEYGGAHVAADAEFAAATSYSVVDRKVFWIGDLAACVITQSHTTGTYQKQSLDLIGTETMLLRRSGDGWLIQHAHWSAIRPSMRHRRRPLRANSHSERTPCSRSCLRR